MSNSAIALTERLERIEHHHPDCWVFRDNDYDSRVTVAKAWTDDPNVAARIAAHIEAAWHAGREAGKKDGRRELQRQLRRLINLQGQC